MSKHNTLYDWANMSSHSILNDVDSNDKRLLLLFLKDYTDITGEKVNASCSKCLNEYINKYKNLFSMESKNESKFKLRKEYQNIPLKFGSPILVNNKNITDEYGEILTERFKALGTKPSVIFKEFPAELETEEHGGLEVVGKEKPAKTEKTAKTETVKPAKPATKDEVKKEENSGLSDEDLSKALNIEVVEPVAESGKDKVVDLEKE